jgi:hypothetical protein
MAGAAAPKAGFLSSLSPRERTLVMALVLTFFVMGTLVLFYLRAQTLRETDAAVDAHKLALQAVYTRGSVYKDRLESKKKRERNIPSTSVQFLTLVEAAQAGVEGVTVSDQEEVTPQTLEGNLIKRSFKFKLRSVTLEQAMKFLTALESEPGRIILTEQLAVRSPSSLEDRLNLDVVISTWEREAEEELEEEEEEE